MQFCNSLQVLDQIHGFKPLVHTSGSHLWFTPLVHTPLRDSPQVLERALMQCTVLTEGDIVRVDCTPAESAEEAAGREGAGGDGAGAVAGRPGADVGGVDVDMQPAGTEGMEEDESRDVTPLPVHAPRARIVYELLVRTQCEI